MNVHRISPVWKSTGRRSHLRARRGLSLLEIVLAMGLAAIAITLLSQLVSIGNKASVVARDQSKAQIMAESIMGEYTSGVAGTPDAITSTSGISELDPDWQYDVAVTPNAAGTINVITVTVSQVDAQDPVSFSLTQWLAIPPEPEEEEELDTGGAI